MNAQEDQYVNQQPCSNGCKQGVNSEPCTGGCKKRFADFESSTLILSKIYQRKRKRLVTSQRKSETSLPASESDQLNGNCHLQEEGNLRKNEMVTPIYRISGNGEAYIKEVIAREGEVDGECFNDLSDFIVCKDGRNYSRWMKLRFKKRKKKMRKTVLQRMKAKRALVSLLTSRNNAHF
ncbi:hypothetical protein L7F22_012814 [Adiantum nelumboides]|nr:hypothetical protein [Adiantum nelumboides]